MIVPPAGPHADAGTPEFPVEFEEPEDAALTWEWDDMHMPFATMPLGADYVRTLAGGFNDRYDRLGPFPQRWKAAIWNGYAYFAIRLDGTEEEQADVRRRWEAVCREQIDLVRRYWDEEALPELRSIYERIASIDVETLPADALVQRWEEAWAGGQRAWAIHFLAIMGPYQVVEDLADFYERVVPDPLPGEALRLMQGFGDDLYAVEIGIERLAALARRTPGVAARLRAGSRVERSDLLDADDGATFVAELDDFLARHGHLGQGFDDLSLPSWAEEPGLLLAELAKRVDRPAVSAERRRERLRAEADRLAEGVRTILADRPDELAQFERLLASARDVGQLTEGHNYWIDRMVQARLRALAMRVGRRLVAEGTIEAVEDVFFLERADITAALLEPGDRRSLVEERKREHAARQALHPPRTVGAERPPEPTSTVDSFDGARMASDDPNELRGNGASAGIVRGTARVALSPDDFGRIQPGDIIVCPSSNPSWVPVFAIAGGLVTNTGGVLSHAAVVAREFGLPAVVGTGDATARIADGRTVEIDGTRGTVRLL
jgi:phosphohistidine swiveling domain-containing protein